MLDENLFVESAAAGNLLAEHLWIVLAVGVGLTVLAILVPGATIKLSLASVGRSITLRRATAVATVASMLTVSFSIGQFALLGQSHAWISLPLMLLATAMAITGIGRCEPVRAVGAAVLSFIFVSMAGVGLAMVAAVGVWWFGASDLTAGGQDLLAASAAGFGPMIDMEALLVSDEPAEDDGLGAADLASGMLSGVGKMAGLAASSGMMDDVNLGTLVSVGQQVAGGADLQGGPAGGIGDMGLDLSAGAAGSGAGNGLADFSGMAGDLNAAAGRGNGGDGLADFSAIAGDLTAVAGPGAGHGVGLEGSLGDLSGTVGDVTTLTGGGGLGSGFGSGLEGGLSHGFDGLGTVGGGGPGGLVSTGAATGLTTRGTAVSPTVSTRPAAPIRSNPFFQSPQPVATEASSVPRQIGNDPPSWPTDPWVPQ